MGEHKSLNTAHPRVVLHVLRLNFDAFALPSEHSPQKTRLLRRPSELQLN